MHRRVIAPALALLVIATSTQATEYPVHNPVTEDAELIRETFADPVDGHMIVDMSESFAEIIERSTVERDYFASQIERDSPTLDVVRPVRFTYPDADKGFTVPAAMRVYISRRGKKFDGEPNYSNALDAMYAGVIVVRKTPIYAEPEDALAEAQAWASFLEDLGYERAEMLAERTPEEFLEDAHEYFHKGIAHEYPAFEMSGWRDGHVGIRVTIQRSPHPERDGPEAHGYNIGIGIVDLRVRRL